VERRAIAVLSAALLVSLLAVAFLLGRQSRSSLDTAVPVPASTGSARVAAPVYPSDAPSTPGSEALETIAPVAPTASAAPTALPMPSAWAALGDGAPTTAADAAGSATGEGVKAEVARYFSEIDQLQAATKSWDGSPEAVAQAMLQQATEGNTAQFDALLTSYRTLAAGLQSIKVPPPCERHRQASARVVQASIQLMETLRGAITQGDLSGIAALGLAGQKIETDAREADRIADEIKKAYGL
jgi:hypothetical protein